MLIEKYFECLESKLSEIKRNPEQIYQAAKMCADCLERGGVLHVFDSGHLISHELIYRAGGLAALSQLSFNLNITNPVKTRSDRALLEGNTLSYGYIAQIFESNQLRKGDILFVGSVSGKSANVVELAIQGRAHGLQVIAVSAIAYSLQLASDHPSGKHLYEVADLILNNFAPYGDAMLEVDGLDYPICPASGVNAAVVMWAVVAGIVEEMLSRGYKPSIFPSINRPDGNKLVKQVEEEALRKGY